MKIKVSEALGLPLDWLVAKIEGRECYVKTGPKSGKKYLMAFTYCCLTGEKEHSEVFNPSENWSQGGPIIERENIALRPHYVKGIDCVAYMALPDLLNNWKCTGKTPLIAAMRCYVASKLGDEVEVPDEIF